jgi:2-dehydropantoate 2-reductase
VRFIVFGAGAIGGVTGARLHQAGHDVTLIARGAHFHAIERDGLRIEDPGETATLRVAVAQTPGDVDFGGDEVVLLATKSQDSEAALRALAPVAGPDATIVCLQNGVENERVALRRFANVYGAVVMVPAAHIEPGTVQAFGVKLTGVIDVGRYPDGVDDRCLRIVEALGAARFISVARPDVMRFKHAKLIVNLANAVEAMCGPGPASEQLIARARDEAREVLRVARIDYVAGEVEDVRGRWERLGVRDIAGRVRGGSSTRQSLARATGSVESDYLNGEIVLLGRRLGMPVPVNQLIQASIGKLAAERVQPGSVSAEDLLAQLG